MLYSIKPLIGPTFNSAPSITVPYGINKKGDVVGVAYSPDGSAATGVLWPAAGPMFALDWNSHSVFMGINSQGEIVGTRGTGTAATAIPILVQGGVVKDLTQYIGEGNYCVDINDAGMICGTANSGQAFIYDSTTHQLTRLDFGFASAINQAGDVVGMGPSVGIFYSNGATTILGPVNASDTVVTLNIAGLNDHGKVVGGVPTQQGEGYPVAAVWDTTTPPPPNTPLLPTVINIPLSFGEAIQSYANGINNQGVVVGSIGPGSISSLTPGPVGPAAAFVIQNGIPVNLQLVTPGAVGWQFQEANGINDAGQIIGNGGFNNNSVGFLLTPFTSIPVPPTPTYVPGNPALLGLIATLLFGGIKVDGPGTAVIGGQPHPVGPFGPVEFAQANLEILMGLAINEMAAYFGNAASREAIRHIVLGQARSRIDEMIARAAASPAPAVRAPAGGVFGASKYKFLSQHIKMHRPKK